MPGPHPATAAIRYAVRSALTPAAPGVVVLVGLSGGADSLALAAAAAFEGERLGLRVGAVVIDHGLQPDSAEVAATAAEQARALGLDPVEMVTLDVTVGADGLEAAARRARYEVFEAIATHLETQVSSDGRCQVLLGHTLDDQAEQVLLGLARGSGARSLAGMPSARGRFRRPLLGITRAQARASCLAEGLTWWDDPMNEDPAYARVRARAAVADLDRDLGPGLAAALARSADQLRADADLLDQLADEAFGALLPEDPTLPEIGVTVEGLMALPVALRTRVWRRLLIAAGAPPGQVSSRHTEACDALLTNWRGQGPLHVPGDLRVTRRDCTVTIGPAVTADRER